MWLPHNWVACINALDPIEDQQCAAFKLMLWFCYTEYVNFPKLYTFWHLLEAKHTYWLAVSYNENYFSFALNTAEGTTTSN